MRSSLVCLAGLSLFHGAHVSAAPTTQEQTTSLSPRHTSEGPIVDLGAAGKYLGVIQNNGTVASWKGIPYAAPPVGDLRFKGPRPLSAQNDTLVDVSAEFPGVQYGCVQFGTTSFVGVNAGPGQEDCLKLWVWAPAGAKEGDKLAVHVYTHGGGMQNSQSPNNDFSDFVGQDQKFIAVNANYRLGMLGFWNSAGLAGEGEDANAGLQDARFAVSWVVKNIAKFGGDPGNIAIAGQSGGGGMIMDSLVLYDGKGAQFQKAIPRSIQRAPALNVSELTPRNDAFAATLNCTDSAATTDGAKSQLACMRKVSAESIRLAALNFSSVVSPTGFPWSGWLPSVDGTSLTDQPTRLYREGKFAVVPVMPGHVTQEDARLVPLDGNFTHTVYSKIGQPAPASWFDLIINTLYPPAIGANYSSNTGTYQDAAHRQWQFQDDAGLGSCVSPMVARAYSDHNAAVYEFVFDAPQPGYPAYESATHSSDNYFLQNATSTMNTTQADIAYEWRAYTASFIRHSDPNVEKLDTSPTWHQSSSEYRYEPRMTFQSKINATTSTAPTNTGMQLMDSAQWDRCSFWNGEDAAKYTRE